ncbi:MAG: helix-turn-helix domain-containing protein [Bacteroidetes bacterium]|nr:helix-turn-helix domain-containing protein [Bacteroidota bacterium]
MKPTFEQISGNTNTSFLWRRFVQARFDAPFHFHPEIELTYIIKGRGKRMVGRQVSSFEPGDLVLLGSNLPHTWLSTDYLNDSKAAEQVVIQFKKEFVGNEFWEMPEMAKVNQLLEKAKYGIHIFGKTRDALGKKMNQKTELKPAQKFLQLIDLLLIISESKEVSVIDYHFMEHPPTPLDTERFRKVYAFLSENYTTEVPLESIAAVANLSPTSFCRFFKKIARQTFVEALTHFRVNHAANLLATTEKSVAEICFESGFSNISYFNKAFKKALGQNPVTYRKNQ